MTMKKEEDMQSSSGANYRRAKSRKIPLEVKTTITKRSIFKIFQKITIKLQTQLIQNIGEEYADNIELALRDKEIQNQIKYMMKQDKIQLLDSKNKPRYTNYIAQAAIEDIDQSPVRQDSSGSKE